MLILSAHDVARCLPMDQAIASLREAFTVWQTGGGRMPQRVVQETPDGAGITLSMPGLLQFAGGSRSAVKVVSVYPGNRERGLPVLHGFVLLLDAATGRVLAGMDGGSLTAIRTGAAAGLGADLLARADARVAALFGAGVQARTALEAICTVRPVSEVRVFGPTARRVEALIEEMAPRMPAVALRAARTPRDAMQGADIVCTATTSAVPVFDPADAVPGMHISALGVFEPEKRELPAETVARSLFFVDEQEAALEEAGDFLIPLREGLVTRRHIAGTLGQLLTGEAAGRTADDQLTVFKSVGLAIQDVAAAASVYARARAEGLGTAVDL